MQCLADDFIRRTRLGERPSLAEYCERFPQHADDIRRLFPTAMFLERLKPSTGELESGRSLPPAPSAAPQCLGDFRILREIGRGGMGVVYEAEQQSLGRRVALKILSQAGGHDAKNLERFQREARSAARLHHTNIVPVFGVGSHDDIHFLVMQLIPGQGLDHVLVELRRLRHLPNPAAARNPPNPSLVAESLARALQTGDSRAHSESLAGSEVPAAARSALQTISDAVKTPPPAAAADTSPLALGWTATASRGPSSATSLGAAYWRSVARMGIDVARALEHAHSQGVLHRDIKPSNLLLDVHGGVWVADFGLAKAEDSGSLTLSGEFVGTLRYMAPERFHGQYDQRSDLYGLGLTLYEMLTLTPAFETSDRGRLVSQVMQASPRPMRQIDGSIPVDLETIVSKAVAANPADRYQSAGELADDLQRFLDDLPIAARPASALERLWRWRRRNPAIALSLATCLVLLLAWGVTSSVLAVRLNAARADAVFERTIADRRREESDNHRSQAVQRGEEARASAEESRNHLVRLNVAQGARLVEEGDPLGALPYFAEALRLDQGDAARERLHRIRLKAALRNSPRLVAIDRAPQESTTDHFSPDGKLLASGAVNGYRRGMLLTPSSLLNHFPELLAANVLRLRPSQATPKVATEEYRQTATSVQILEIPTLNPVCRLHHAQRVTDYVFSPDSQKIATAGLDGSIQVWNARTGEPRATAVGNPPGGVGLTFIAGGDYLISAGPDLMARVWNSTTGALTASIPLPDLKANVCTHPQSRLIVVIGPSLAEIREALTGVIVGEPIPRLDSQFSALLHDGRELLLAGGTPFARRYDTATGRQVSSSPGASGRVALSHESGSDGKWLVENNVRALRVWDTESGTVVNSRLGWPRMPQSVTFNVAGSRLGIVASDNSFSVWDPRSGEMVCPPMRHAGVMDAARMTADDRYVLTRGRDRELRLWNLSCVRAAALPVPNTLVSWKARTHSSDARFALTHENRTYSIRETSGGTLVANLGEPDSISLYDLDDEGRFVIGGKRNGSMRLWNTATGEPASDVMHCPAELWQVRVSRNGERVVTHSADGVLRTWDPRQPDRPVSELFAGPGHLELSLSPTGDHVVASQQMGRGGEPSSDLLCDLRDGRIVGAYPRSSRLPPITPVVFSGDGTKWLSNIDSEVIVRETANGRVVVRCERPSDTVVVATFVGPARVVIASRDGGLHLWDLAAGRLIRDIPGHYGRIFSLAADDDGLLFMTVATDETVRVWEATTGDLIALLTHSRAVSKAWFLPGSSVVATVDSSGGVSRWDLHPDGRPVGDWQSIAELLAGRQPSLNISGSARPPEDAEQAWNRLRAAYPQDFSVSSELGTK